MNKDGSEATLDNDSMKGVLDAYKELANTTNGLGAGSKEETGAPGPLRSRTQDRRYALPEHLHHCSVRC